MLTGTMRPPLRIAQVAPLIESVPPKGYGGVERVVAYLCDELVRLGHHVTLFASSDSRTSARLVGVVERAQREFEIQDDYWPQHMCLAERVLGEAGEFDLIHFHVDAAHYPAARRSPIPTVTTVHGRLDWAAIQPLYCEFQELPRISVSYSQRKPLPNLNWLTTIHHGVPTGLYQLNPVAGNYLAFLGRISPEKGPDEAIRIAKAAGVPLKIAAKIDKIDIAYHESYIAPLLTDPGIEFLGEIDDQMKNDLLRNALALLFPINWEEPFGLAMIEAMACGTPVVAYRRGSTSEVVDDGTTGFLVDGWQAAARAIAERVPGLNRSAIRHVFEQRFTSGRMARDYLEVYERMLAKRRDNRIQTPDHG